MELDMCISTYLVFLLPVILLALQMAIVCLRRNQGENSTTYNFTHLSCVVQCPNTVYTLGSHGVVSGWVKGRCMHVYSLLWHHHLRGKRKTRVECMCLNADWEGTFRVGKWVNSSCTVWVCTHWGLSCPCFCELIGGSAALVLNSSPFLRASLICSVSAVDKPLGLFLDIQ